MLKNSKSKFVYYGLAWIPPLTLKKRYNVKQKVQGFYHTGLLTEYQWKKKKLLVKNLYCIIINFELQGDVGDMSPVSASPILTL